MATPHFANSGTPWWARAITQPARGGLPQIPIKLTSPEEPSPNILPPPKKNVPYVPYTAPSSTKRKIPSSANFFQGTPRNIPLELITTNSGAKFRVNQAVAGNFKGFLHELESTGYKIYGNQSGGHNHRTIGGSSRWSQHAFGNAIDVNWSLNPLHGGNNLPKNISEMASRWGLTWGGNWSRGSNDPMHFEFHSAHGVTAMKANDPKITSMLASNQPNAPPPKISKVQTTRPSRSPWSTIAKQEPAPKTGLPWWATKISAASSQPPFVSTTDTYKKQTPAIRPS